MKNFLLFTTTAAAVMLLAACGSGQAGQPVTNSPNPTSSTGLSTSGSGSASGTPASPPPTSQQAEPPLCKSGSLQASMASETGGGAAGSVYMKLVLSNSGSAPCLLRGFPGVSLANTPDGEPIGMPAKRDDSVPAVGLVLSPGQSGKAVLRYVQPGNIPECTMTPAQGFRVYPPEDTGSLFIAQPMVACSNNNVQLLTIQTFQAA